MKNPQFVGWEPMYQWTDQKIRMHALYCVLALTPAGLLHRKVRRASMELSLEATFEEMSSIREVINLCVPTSGQAGRPRATITYTEETSLSRRSTDLFRLNELKAR